MDSLLDILSGKKQEFYGSNPWLNTGVSIAKSPVDYSAFNSPFEAIAAGLLQGLTSGGLVGYGKSQADKEYGDFTTKIADALSSGDYSSLSTSADTEPVYAALKLNDFAKQQEVGSKILEAKAKAGFDIQKSLFESYSKAETPQEKRVLEGLMKLKGILPEDFQSPDTQDQPIAEKLNESDYAAPKFGVDSIKEVEKKIFKENLAAGMPRVQAAASSRSAVEDMRKRSKDMYGKDLEKINQDISSLEEVTRLGKEGIDKAGATGSKVASAYEKALSFFPSIFPEAAQQAAGDAALDTARQKGLALNKIPGMGAMSDFESKAAYKAAFGADKTEPQNLQILKQYENALGTAKDYQAFMNVFLEQTGGSPDRANLLWELYKKENPPFVPDGQGGFKINENKIPWQQYDFENAYKKFLSGDMSSTVTGGNAPSAIKTDPLGIR